MALARAWRGYWAVVHDNCRSRVGSGARNSGTAPRALIHGNEEGEQTMLASNSRTMTDFDLRRLNALFERFREQVRMPATLTALEREVAQAVAVKPADIPATVVTMNSQVEVVDLVTKERRSITVVFPSMAAIEDGRISVLAPLGTALLGTREGARLAWNTPRGERQLRVDRVVFQPEAAGRFDL